MRTFRFVARPEPAGNERNLRIPTVDAADGGGRFSVPLFCVEAGAAAGRGWRVPYWFPRRRRAGGHWRGISSGAGPLCEGAAVGV